MQIRNRQYPEVLEGYCGEMLLVGVNYNEKMQKHGCRIERGWK